MSESLKKTVFTEFHRDQNARFVPFAGYEMPVSFAGGIAEHHCVRSEDKAGLFDVSHMGQITLSGLNVISEFEKLVPSNIANIADNHAKYTVLTNPEGGIIDDCIVTKNPDGSLFLVVNGSRKEIVLKHLQSQFKDTKITHHEGHGLLALQGGYAFMVLSSIVPQIGNIQFMQSGNFFVDGMQLRVSRCGYTGADGFEISVAPQSAKKLYDLIINHDAVMSIGLGARDTLRLEAGLCLYGNDLDETTTPVEADLGWIISKEKTQNLAYIGAEIIREQRATGISRKRVGLLPDCKAPMRQGVVLFDNNDNEIGVITSGTFSPTLEKPIAMGYVKPDFATVGTRIFGEVRGKKLPVTIAKMPFVPHQYVKG